MSGKGTRFILANTEQLHSKIQEMSDRIRSLEEGLQVLHAERASNPDQPHPLLQPELLGIKSTMGLYSGTQAHTSDSGQSANSTAKPAQHMEVDRSPPAERGSSEDTITAPDHLHPAKVSCRGVVTSSSIILTDMTRFRRKSTQRHTSLPRLSV